MYYKSWNAFAVTRARNFHHSKEFVKQKKTLSRSPPESRGGETSITIDCVLTDITCVTVGSEQVKKNFFYFGGKNLYSGEWWHLLPYS